MQLLRKIFWKIIVVDYLFQVLSSTVNTQAMPKRIVGPGAMKMELKGEFISDFSITWPKAKDCGFHPGTFCLPSNLISEI